MVVDEDGIAAFDRSEAARPGWWEEATALVRRPVHTARINPGEEKDLRGTGDAGKAPVLRCRRDDDRLVTQSKGAPQFTRLTVQPPTDNRPTLVRHLGPDSAAHPVPDTSGALVLRAYE